LLVPSKESLKRALNEKQIKHDSPEAEEEAIKLINSEINKFKAGGEMGDMFPDRWIPSTFAILEEGFTEQNGLVNSTMKIVRGKVEEKYKDSLTYLYTPEGKNYLNQRNREIVRNLLSN